MTSQEAREKLAALEAELAQVKANREALQMAIEAADLRIRQLAWGSGSIGEIATARRHVEECERIEADELLPKAMVLGVPYVIDKVTPKRIFLRRVGGNVAVQYDRHGRRVAHWDFTIDNREEIVAIADAMGPKRG